MKKIKIFYFVSTALLAIPMTMSCAKNDDFTILRDAYKEHLIQTVNTSAFDNKTPEEIKSKLDSETISGVNTYHYKNGIIDYSDDGSASPNSWKVAQHTTDMLAIAVTAAKKHDPQYQEIAVGLTYYWVFNDFRCVNWWFNDLGCGSSLSSTALFVYDDLNEMGKAAVYARVARQSFYYNESLLGQTGSNLFDYADCSLKSSIIHRNRIEFELTVQRIEDEIVYSNIEGFTPDGSFFQHGTQLQTMSNYGRSIIRLAPILNIVDKTSRHFSLEKLKILTKFILKGISRGMFKGYSNYLEVAREFARDDENCKSEAYLGLEKYLDLPDLPSRHEFEEFISKLKVNRPTFNGITYFEDAKFVTMNIDGLYMAFEGSDHNIINTETVNGENILGLNLSYGTNTCVMDRGQEYYHISPVWDYAYLPGTTSFQIKDYPDNPTEAQQKQYFDNTDSKIYEITRNVYKDTVLGKPLPEATTPTNDVVYGGGYNETHNIACLMQRSCHHDENHFTVTCVACEDGMFLMGSDIYYDGSITKLSDVKMHTTLEQCFYNEKGKDEELPLLSEDKQELIHGNAYYRLYDDPNSHNEPNTINIRGYNDTADNVDYNVVGDWKRNNDNVASKKAEGKLLLASINYPDGVGASSSNPIKYAYSIQPKSYRGRQTADKKFNREFKLINNFNNGAIQEVRLPADENGRYKAVIAAYNDIDEYEACNGETINNLKKGQFYIVEGLLKE